MSRPVLTGDQKAYLIYEIMLWASVTEEVNTTDTTKADLYRLMRTIVMDDLSRISANNSQRYIQQLRKSGELWDKVRPFLWNSNTSCTATSTHISHGKCGHGPEMHINGKCTGTHREWVHNPNAPANMPSWNRSSIAGSYLTMPCQCVGYKTNQTW